MANCKKCDQKKGFFELIDGICDSCRNEVTRQKAQEIADAEEKIRLDAKRVQDAKSTSIQKITLTTETSHNLNVIERLGVIATEVIVGQHLGKEMLVGLRDLVGGRSKSLQNTFREAREIAFDEIRLEAYELGADAVVGIDIDYLDVSSVGTMPMVVVSGTAVKVKCDN